MPILAYLHSQLRADGCLSKHERSPGSANLLLQGSALTVLHGTSEGPDAELCPDASIHVLKNPERIPVDFSAAVASECLELQRTGEQNIFIGVGSASLSFLLTFMHQLHFAAAFRPSFVLTASSQQRRSRTGKRTRRRSFGTFGRHFHLLHAPLQEDAAEHQQASGDEQLQPSMPGMLQPRGWQSSAEWGITQLLASLGCCTVRTSSFDLDDLDKADEAAAATAAAQAKQPAAQLPQAMPAAELHRSKSLPYLADSHEDRVLSSRSSPEMRSSLWDCQHCAVGPPRSAFMDSHILQNGSLDPECMQSDLAATAGSDASEDIFSTAQDIIMPSALGDAEAEQPKQLLTRQPSLSRSDSAMQQADLVDPPLMAKAAEPKQPSLHGCIVCAVADNATAASLKHQLLQHTSPDFAKVVRFQIGLPLQLLLSAGSRSYDYVVIESRRQPIETQEPSAALIGSAIRATRPGGRVVYTSSGLLPAQNDRAVKRALSRQSDAREMQLNPDYHINSADQELAGKTLHGLLSRQQRTEMGFLLKQPSEYVQLQQYLSIMQKVGDQ